MSEEGYTPQPLAARLRRAARSRGARPVAGDFARWGANALAGLPWTRFGSHGQFAFQGEAYGYLFHRYNLTWLTERAVEVPVVQAIVDRHAGERILEVGNVLSHYRSQSHLVVDKYERGRGVLNRDVLDLDDLGPFDLIVAISTLEHVGWGNEGHEYVNRVAAQNIPAEMPRFLRRAVSELTYLGPEPDRWRSPSEYALKNAQEPDHFIDLERVAWLDPLPPGRYEFYRKLYRSERQPPSIPTNYFPACGPSTLHHDGSLRPTEGSLSGIPASASSAPANRSG